MERTYQMMLVDHSKVNSDVTSGERDFSPHPLLSLIRNMSETFGRKIGWKRCFFIHPAVKDMPSTSPRFGSCIAAFAAFRNHLLLRVPWVELQGGAERALFCEFGEATRANKWFQMQYFDIFFWYVLMIIQYYSCLQVIYVYKVVACIYRLMFIATENGYSSGLMIYFWMNR